MQGKPVYLTWWFWVVFAVLITGSFYLRGYFEWKGDTANSQEGNILNYTLSQYLQNQSQELEETYRNDRHGGETPEETLRLYVEALENEDVELASKYYLVEKQKAAWQNLSLSKERGYLDDYLTVLNGEKEDVHFSDGITFEFIFFDKAGNRVHVEQLQLNEFTNIWKLVLP